MVDAKSLTKAQARDEVLVLLDRARDIIPGERPADLPGKVNSEGVDIPGWHNFEHDLWRYSADVWDLLIAHPTLRNDDALIEQIVAIVTNRAAMRGRQSFILACGSVKHASHAPQFAAQLDDPGVDGQVLSTLIKVRAGDYTAQVRPFLDSPTAFIRKLAKSYLAKYDVSLP